MVDLREMGRREETAAAPCISSVARPDSGRCVVGAEGFFEQSFIAGGRCL